MRVGLAKFIGRFRQDQVTASAPPGQQGSGLTVQRWFRYPLLHRNNVKS